MHPALPSYVHPGVTKYSKARSGRSISPCCAWRLAPAHPRGFLLGAVASAEAAAKELRGRWGLPIEAGEVKFLRRA